MLYKTISFSRGTKMKIFEQQGNRLKVGQEAEDFSIGYDLFLSNLKGSPVFFVFWKTL